MLITDADRTFAHIVRYRDRLLRLWLGDRCSYKPEEIPAHIQEPSNEDRSRAEVIEFITKPVQHGDGYFAYLTRDKDGGHRITTFMGDTLATVRSISRYPFRGTLSNERGSFWARGIDGRIYYGRHFGAGLYCRMRLSKQQGVAL